MRALVFHKIGDVKVETVKDPVIEKPTDVVIKVSSTAICGSDLHILDGMFPQVKDLVLGHEFMGDVVEVGALVKKFKIGDRVIVPFPISCGSCWFCEHSLTTHCENSNPQNYGPEGGLLKQKGSGLYGYTDLYGGYAGGQAEYARVLFADDNCRLAPEGFEDEKVLFLTDIFPTGYASIDWAQMRGGETVAVFGCGPVGLMAQKTAWLKGASRVIGLDVEEYRMKVARETCMSETINVKDSHAIQKIREMTGGRGADIVVDAVGMEPDRSIMDRVASVVRMEKGSINALRMCLDAVRRGGFVSVVGVYGMNYDNFPLAQIFEKGLTIRAGQVMVHKYIDHLTTLVREGKIVLNDIISHRLPLSDAERAYKIFRDKEDNCVKVVLKP